MKKEPAIQDLSAEKAQLLQSLRLFDLVVSKEAPDFLKRIELSFVKDLFGGTDLPWGEEGLFPESARFLAQVRKSEEGQRLCLQSDIEVLRKVRDSGSDQPHRCAFGMVETVFPVRVRGKVVHCVWSGKVREHPFSADEIAQIARVTSLPKAQAEELAASVPVMKKKEIDRAMAFVSRMRNSVEHALASHVRAAELTDQLVQSERTQSVGTLSGGVAHHFNNLLSVILGYSSFVLNRETVSKEASDALHKIMDAAQRGRRLTEEVLAFLGSEVEEDVPCRVHETLNSVLSLLESKTGSAVKVEAHLDAARDTVIATPSSIRQIVFNLLMNAIDSMPGGGVLTIGTSNTQMAGGSGRQDFFKLEVTDTGGALPPGARTGPAIGERQMPGDRIGLKLSSVYGMVGRLEGTVLVSSEPGTVTCVQVLLPTVAEGAAVEEEKKIKRRLAPSRIWVVDDDAIFREMCRQVLSDEGHTIEEMAGGREFQDKWRRGPGRPDLILMDFSMPEYNGLQLCDWLRNEGAKVPVILVSGFAANQPDIRKALRLKKTYFLQKPFSFREMADTITVALGETLIGE